MIQEEYDALSPEEKVEALKGLAQRAVEANSRKCSFCATPVFLAYDTEARIKGHIYSDEGKSEINITGICEYCFDELFDDEGEPLIEDKGNDPEEGN